MDFRDSPAGAAFRERVRCFIQEHRPTRATHQSGHWGATNAGTHELWRDAEYHGWLRMLSTEGWVCPSWPTQYGGADLSRVGQVILLEEMAFAQVPRPDAIGQNVGAALLGFGSEDQKREHLPRIARGEVLWCQGFSEPGAGSDLASLQTRAVPDGDEYVINGQKIWTSYAHISNWIHLLVRTGSDAVKHAGLTYLILPMDTPGVTVSPLRNLRGEYEFNQVFLDNVRVPVAARVGEEGQAWQIAKHVLDTERTNVAIGVDLIVIVREALRCAAELGLPTCARRELVERYVEAEVGRLLSMRVFLSDDRAAWGHQAAAAKVFLTELDIRLADTLVRLFGMRSELLERSAPFGGRVAEYYLHAASSAIAGGTSEVQRNIIATRGLGLPRA